MAHRWPVIIVGDGPAAVAAAFPLVERGIQVLMLGAGVEPAVPPPVPTGTLGEARRSARGWRTLLGERLEALRDFGVASPKLRTPQHAGAFDAFNARYRVRTENFRSIGVLAPGGLAAGWGAGVSTFDDDDLAEYPVEHKDLRAAYGEVSQRIGVSGSNTDDMAAVHGHDMHLMPATECSSSAIALLARYQRNPGAAKARGVTLGRGRNAVATTALLGRLGCAHCGLCLWTCPRRAIWSPVYDLERLREHALFHHEAGCFATALRRRERGWCVYAETEGEGARRFQGERVVLAAGAIGTAKLVVDALGMGGLQVPLRTSPVAGFAVAVPRAALPVLADDRLFALAQLSFRVAAPALERGYATGSLFAADGIPAIELALRAGVSYGLARPLVRVAQPQLLLGNCFFHSAYTRHALRFSANGEITVTGRYAAPLAAHAALVRKRLAAAWWRYGAFLVPGSFRVLPPGEDIHYGGTVPMRRSPKRHEARPTGEVNGLPRVYVVDGAALPCLPPKPHTFTIMANATRIATRLAIVAAGKASA